MNADQYIGFGLAAIGAALLLLNAWMTYTDRKANLIVEQALRNAAIENGDLCPPETVDRMRHVVQAEAWVMERTPLVDTNAERRLAEALQDEDQLRRWLS